MTEVLQRPGRRLAAPETRGDIRRGRKAHRSRTAAFHTFMVVATFIYLFPALWALSMSFRTDANLFSTDQFIPHPITFEHYVELFQFFPQFGTYFFNTLLIAVLGTAGLLVSSSMAGYALARLDVPGRSIVLALLLLTLMVPVQATLIPQFTMFRVLGWINTPLPIIVPMCFGNALSTFFFRQFFLTLPNELEDAAEMDGAGYARTFVSVIAPLSRPAFLAIGMLTFVNLWNGYFLNAVYLQSPSSWVLTQALQSLVGQNVSQYGIIMAGVVVVSLPIIVVYVLLQRYIIASIAATGIAN